MAEKLQKCDLRSLRHLLIRNKKLEENCRIKIEELTKKNDELKCDTTLDPEKRKKRSRKIQVQIIIEEGEMEFWSDEGMILSSYNYTYGTC